MLRFDLLHEGLSIGGLTPTAINNYSGHVKSTEVLEDAIGDTLSVMKPALQTTEGKATGRVSFIAKWTKRLLTN